jgi:glyoxylase-like metal-dependent hydrolase (beta-lactamase superfamily II)
MEGMRIEKLEDDLLVAVGAQYESSTAIFLDGERALLVDGMASRKDALELRRFVEEDLERKVRLLVSTHYFSDHLAAWGCFPGIPIVAHRNYRQSFDAEVFRSEEEKGHYVEPTVLVGEALEIVWGRFHLDVFYNPGHTLCSLAIDVAEADLLLAGDTVVGNIAYLYYANVALRKRALERLRARRRGKLLSSHTGVSDPARLDRALHYLERLSEKAVETRGARFPDIPLESCLPPGIPATEFERTYHRRNLDLILEGRIFAAS